MPGRFADHEDDTDWEDDDEHFDDDYSSEEEPTIECPYCRVEIHEDAQRCPHCDNYISAEDSSQPRKPWWVIVAALVCLYIVFRWVTSAIG